MTSSKFFEGEWREVTQPTEVTLRGEVIFVALPPGSLEATAIDKNPVPRGPWLGRPAPKPSTKQEKAPRRFG